MKERRKKEILERKSFLPTLAVIALLILFLTALVIFVDPVAFGAVILFLILVFLVVLFTFALIFGNSRRGFVAAIALTVFLLLKYLGIGNLLNLILIVCIALAFEIYWANK